METLLRQKVCKSKHNFLITKQLEDKKDERKREKTVFSEANGLGIFGIYFPAIRTARRFAPIGAKQDSYRLLGHKKT
jgi:hypothetical protein